MEKAIIKIEIKGHSGWGTVESAYHDKITLTSTAIKYEYVPDSMNNSKTNVYRKWNYSTNSPDFSDLYNRIAMMMPDILYQMESPDCSDTGEIEFIITFEDKRKVSRTYFTDGDYFKDCFNLICKMVPTIEEMPSVFC